MNAKAQPAGGPLPRGRHKLSPETVRANQRQRMFLSAGTLVVERGYSSLTVAGITASARISRATFYAHFEDKLDCLLAAHDEAQEGLMTAIETACQAFPEWPRNVVAAVHSALAFVISAPYSATLLTIDPAGVEPRLSAQMLSTHRQLSDLLRTASERGGQPARLPQLTERAMIGGACAVIGETLGDGEPAAIGVFAPQLAQLILLPYLGPLDAQLAADASP